MKSRIFIFILLVAAIFAAGYYSKNEKLSTVQNASKTVSTILGNNDPMAIEVMRQKDYPGSALNKEYDLGIVSGYHKYIVSYLSDGFKIRALLTVPTGSVPAGGWPAIIVNHGYIPPLQYITGSSYAAIFSPLASAGYVVLMPDYRGNGYSEGKAEQVYVSPSYVTDSMNALASIKKYKDVNPKKIGVLGHSMGGNVTLHDLVLTHDFKAGVILAGVVGSESDILSWWDRRKASNIIYGNDLDAYNALQQTISKKGRPSDNPIFWNSIDPTTFLSDINASILIQVGGADNVVPPSFSDYLRTVLQKENKNVSFYNYPGEDHNFQGNIEIVMQRSIDFFNKILK